MIKIKQMNKRYDDKIILDDVSLDINRGEIIGLLAPNATGKTTLLKILGGQKCFDSGEYEFLGEVFEAAHKAHIGYMPSSGMFPLNWRIKDTVNFYQHHFTTFNLEKCQNMLTEFKLEPKMRLKNLSKGIEEKLYLALAMSIDASLYILDEPLAAVDILARDVVIEKIMKTFNADSTILIATHLVADIEVMLDRVLFLKNGCIVENVLVEDLRASGKSVVSRYKEVFSDEDIC